MIWAGTFFNSSDELFNGGLEGYFTLSVGAGGGVPTRLDTTTSAPVSFGMDNFLARINFFGTNLTTATERLPIGSELEVLTGGTINRITFEYNYNLGRVIDQGGDPSPFFSAAFLEPSADLRLPNVSAVVLTTAILQSYQARNVQPLSDFLSANSAHFDGTSGVNFINGFNGPDILRGLDGNDVLSGNGGNDILDGGPGTDSLSGGEGSDYYLPGPGANSFGIGDAITDSGTNPGDIDTVSYANAPAGVVVDLNFQDGDQSAGWAKALQASGIEAIEGSRFNDTLMGTDFPESIQDTAADLLIGGFGDDILFGFSGSDILQGGPGFDTLVGGVNGDISNQGPGDVARFNAASNQLAVFYQNDGSVLVAAPGGGVDTLFEMEFIETTDGRFAINAFTASTRELLIGTEGNSPLTGTAGDDLIFGRDGDDTLRGAAGNDVIEGENGRDTIDAGTGNDFASGGAGNDTLNGRGGRDTLNGDDGADVIKGGGGADQMSGGDGNDKLNGSLGRDVLRGDDGDDVLRGGKGNDMIIGGAGDDKLFGGGGRDSFAFSFGSGKDIIRDLKDGETIDLGRDLFTGQISRKKIVNAFGEDRGNSFLLDFGEDELLLRNVADKSDVFDVLNLV